MSEIKIYGSLRNDTPDGYVTKTEDVYDEEFGKTQAEINASLGSGNGFYNLDNEHPLEDVNYTLETAVATICEDTTIDAQTKNGMIITFFDGGEWKTYRYKNEYDPEDVDADEKFADVDNWEEFNSGSGGGDTSSRIVLRRESPNVVCKVGSTVSIRFYYDHVEGTGSDEQSTGNSGQARIIITRAGFQQVIQRTLAAGTHSQIDITKYMGIGVTNVRLQVTVDTGLTTQSSALAWTVSEVLLNLTTDGVTGYTVVENGTNLEVPYTLESGSSDTKSVVCYFDGVQYSQQTIATSIGSGMFTIDTSQLNHGQHTVQLRAQQSTGEVDEHDQPVLIYSNLIYAVVGVYTEEGTTPIVTMKVSLEDATTIFGANDTLVINMNQYDTLSFGYGAFTNGTISTEVTIKEGNNVLVTNTNNREEFTFSTRVVEDGTYSYTINVGQNAQVAMSVVAAEVELGVNVPSGRDMYLDSVQHGHTNSEANRNTWTNTEGGVQTTTTMTNFTWIGDGWIDGALRLNGSARAVINFKPLQSTQSGGMVAGFKYKCTNVGDGAENNVVISCIDENDTGLYITPTEIGMKQGGTTRTSLKTAIGDVYDVAFVVWPASGSSADVQKNARFIYLYINGIMSGGYRLAQGSSMFQVNSVNISVGVNDVTLDLYRIWAYNRALNDSEMLDTFILDQDDNINRLLELRDDNNILDGAGNVTPDSLPDGTRIMIITGQAATTGGTVMASVLAAAAENKKSKYFPCTEISTYIKGASDRSKNFIAHNNGSDMQDGQDMSLKLRLQGTSSLAYPVKNYRIYTKKSTMYVGNNPDMPFGETGDLASGGKFAMHDDSVPVAVWCLKADYAESSSTHNTGMARMVNDTLKACNIPTPAQRDVNTQSYPYEVRTTVDGEPMVLFYRETFADTPVFLGKFNFNNDKSTEAVYGFTGIPGYHDVAPLNNIANSETGFTAQQFYNLHHTESGYEDVGDLTECWEFRNNEDPMGSFLDDDFTTDVTDEEGTHRKWTGTFEARYPDEDDLNDDFESGAIDPYYLHSLISWVKSTHVESGDTEQQAAAKLAKFHNELSGYFDVEHLCSYFVFTQIMACLDQMVKNMMMGFWYDKNATSNATMGKVRAYMIFYDNDTILGLINNGRLLAPWDVKRDTIQMYDAGGNPVYFYAGHESVLWNNLVAMFPNEIRNAYVKVRSFLTNTKIFQYFDQDQASKFSERIYNLDALNKYVAPSGMSETDVAPYRDLMQGSRKSHRHYFLENRLSLIDNEWRAGEFYSSANEISFKGISAGGSAITYTICRDGNVEVQSDVSDDFVTNYPSQGNVSYTISKLTASAVGTIFHIYGMRQLKKLNVAEWDFDQLNLGNFQYLEEFIFGSLLKTDGETANTFTKPYYNSGLVVGNSMPYLKKFIAQNCTELPSVDLSGCSMIEEIDFSGSIKLISCTIPVGARISKYILPSSYSSGATYQPFNLSLIGLPNLDEWNSEEEIGLKVGDLSKIQSLTFRDCPLIDGFVLLKNIAEANNTSLNQVDVTLPNSISGSISDLISIANRWSSNSGTGENSNIKVLGSYTVTDAILTESQCVAVGYDPQGSATQMSSKIYGLMITIDQSTIQKVILQSYDPNAEGYNPAVCIYLSNRNYGTYVDSNDYTKGWFLTKSQAENINGSLFVYDSIGDGQTDVNAIVSESNGDTTKYYYFEKFSEFRYFTSIDSLDWQQFMNCTYLELLVFPNTVLSSAAAFRGIGQNTNEGVIIDFGSGYNRFSGYNPAARYKYFIFRNTTPVVVSGNIYEDAFKSPEKIYVPESAVDAYKSAAFWSNYASIIEKIPDEYL